MSRVRSESPGDQMMREWKISATIALVAAVLVAIFAPIASVAIRGWAGVGVGLAVYIVFWLSFLQRRIRQDKRSKVYAQSLRGGVLLVIEPVFEDAIEKYWGELLAANGLPHSAQTQLASRQLLVNSLYTLGETLGHGLMTQATYDRACVQAMQAEVEVLRAELGIGG